MSKAKCPRVYNQSGIFCMNKSVLIIVSAVAAVTTAGALLVAKDNHRATRLVSQPQTAATLPPSQASPTNQEAPAVTSQASSSNSVSVTNNSSSTTTASSNQSSSTSAVSITVSGDQPSSHNLSFSPGTAVKLTIVVNGSSSLKFSSSSPAVNFGIIAAGSSATSKFTAQSSFTIQPSDPSSGAAKGNPIVINVQP